MTSPGTDLLLEGMGNVIIAARGVESVNERWGRGSWVV